MLFVLSINNGVSDVGNRNYRLTINYLAPRSHAFALRIGPRVIRLPSMFQWRRGFYFNPPVKSENRNGAKPLRRLIFARKKQAIFIVRVVGAARLELATPWSQTRYATNCATP